MVMGLLDSGNGFDDPLTLGLLGISQAMLGAPRNAGFGQTLGAGINGLTQGLLAGGRLQQGRADRLDAREMKELQKKKLQFEMDETERTRAQDAELMEILRGRLSGGGGGTPGVGTLAPAQGGGGAPSPDLLKAGPPMVDYLVNTHGLPRTGAAGVVGGLYQESGFNPSAVGDNGTATGMGQWRLDRRDKLLQFAQAQGKPATDQNLQLDFLVNEMKGGDMGAQRAFQMLQTAKTPEDATAAMMHFFRPAGYTPANPQAGHGYQNRVQYTTQLAGGGMPGQGVAQGDNVQQAQADGSGNQIPPRPAMNAPTPVMPQQPGARPPPMLPPELLLQLQMSKRLAPVGTALQGMDTRRDTIFQSDRDYGLRQQQDQRQSGQWTAEQQAARERESEGKRRWEVERAERAAAAEAKRKSDEEQFGQKKGQDAITNAGKLRDDYRSEPSIKVYRTVVPMLEAAKDAVTRPTRAADLNLVYAFAKLMDPESVVRESEMGMVVQSGTIGDRLNGIVGQLNGGQMLQPETRQRLLDELQSRFVSLEDSYNTVTGVYKGIAERSGLNPDDVVVPIRTGNERRPTTSGSTEPSQDELKRWAGGEPAKPVEYDLVNGKLVPRK